jgi:hypothetical protein
MIILLLFLLIFPTRGIAETFSVGLPIVPQFNPITNQLNVANYIGLHLYDPLFRMNKTGGFESEFLDLTTTKSLDRTFSKYNFCLKDNIHFSDKTTISSSDLATSIGKFSEMYPHLLPLKKIIIENQRCIRIELNESTPNLFKRLTGMASTIVKAIQIDQNYPVGHGSYIVKEIKKDSLLLAYNGSEKPKFDSIDFRLINNVNELSKTQFHDLNQLPPSQYLQIDRTLFDKVDAPTLKVYSLVINIKNAEQRLAAKCGLAKIEWSEVYGLKLEKQNSFLPWAKDVKADTAKAEPLSVCRHMTKKIKMLVMELFDDQKVKTHLAETGLDKKFDVVKVSTKDFAEWAFSGKEYVALMGFDSSGSIASLDGDFSVYFEAFFTKNNRIVSRPLNQVKKHITQALSPGLSATERMALMRKAEKYLLSNGYILPLGRVQRTFFFPKDIVINTWADYFSGFPQVDRIQ